MSEGENMIIYLIPLGFLLVASLFELCHIRLKVRQRKICYFLIVVYLILVAGLRYGLETDYWHYYQVFNGTIKVSSLEFGFKFFNSIIHAITNNYGVYCLLVSVLSIGLKCKFFAKIKYPFVVLACYYLRFYVLFELNAIRQGLAMTFVIIGIYYLMQENKKMYFFFIVIATLFHTAALCGLLAIISKNRKFELKNIVLIYACCIIFRLVFFDTVIASFSPYISYVLNSSNNLIHGMQYVINSGDKMQEINYFSLARVVISGICLYFISDCQDKKMYYNMYFLGSILNLVFWGLDTIAFRIPAVFYIFEGYILNDSLMKHKLFGKRDILFTICFFCIAVCDIWTFVSYLLESTSLIPYRTIIGI